MDGRFCVIILDNSRSFAMAGCLSCRSYLMTEYVTWTPEYDGHKPPLWIGGMAWKRGKLDMTAYAPNWSSGLTYTISREAVSPPFNVESWLAQGRANANKLPDGVILPEPRDWAYDLAQQWCDSTDRFADFIRKHCIPRPR
jgi:hypothetical protein